VKGRLSVLIDVANVIGYPNEKMETDRFRFNWGNLEEKYQEVYNLLCT
jgi:hypothetical protein